MVDAIVETVQDPCSRDRIERGIGRENAQPWAIHRKCGQRSVMCCQRITFLQNLRPPPPHCYFQLACRAWFEDEKSEGKIEGNALCIHFFGKYDRSFPSDSERGGLKRQIVRKIFSWTNHATQPCFSYFDHDFSKSYDGMRHESPCLSIWADSFPD